MFQHRADFADGFAAADGLRHDKGMGGFVKDKTSGERFVERRACRKNTDVRKQACSAAFKRIGNAKDVVGFAVLAVGPTICAISSRTGGMVTFYLRRSVRTRAK